MAMGSVVVSKTSTPTVSTSLDNACIKSEVSTVNDLRNLGKCDHAFGTMYCLECGGIIKIPIWCGDRLCPICAKARARKYGKYLKDKIKKSLDASGEIRFITLTVRNTWRIDFGFLNLRRAFARLREREIWKKNVVGGCYGVEVTNDGHGWHSHIHVVYDGRYIPQGDLSEAWSEVTSDRSYVVDIRRVSDYRGAIRELAKYPFKPADVKGWSDDEKKEFGEFMYGRRLFTKFGSWFGDGHMRSGVTICPLCHAENSLVYLQSLPGADQDCYFADHMSRFEGVGSA